jgi:hypothetical protein
MSKAKLDSTTTTRRRFLAGAAAIAPAAGLAIIASGAVAQAIAAPDPVFAVIEAHKAATKALDHHLDETAVLEKTLPDDRRQSVITARESDGRPEWIANERAVVAACEREREAAMAILKTSPTTLAGVAAILEYSAAYVRNGNEWPDSLTEDGGRDERRGQFWETLFQEMLAKAVQTIAST